MATIDIQPSPHAAHLSLAMTTSRVPLRDAPSAVLNSPLRMNASTATIGQKRQRQTLQNEINDIGRFPHRSQNPRPQTELQKKLEAVRRDKNVSKMDTVTREDQYLAWQTHYRKLFPTLNIYFESLPRDLVNRLGSKIRQLGASEAVFFSKEVTHVITMRQLPDSQQLQSTSPRNLKTINPSMLENNFTFESSKKLATDILIKARDLGIKIWTVEKLNRILNALSLDPDASNVRVDRGAELVQLLKNEKKQTTTDRDWMSEMVQFRGCYIFLHDMDERTKPIMIKDYPKVERKEHGKWPQLRVTGTGKCPFVEDVQSRRSATVAAQRVTDQVHTRTRAATTDSNRVGLKDITNPSISASQSQKQKPLDPPGEIPQKRGSTDHLPQFYQPAIRQPSKLIRGEPVASGLQPSNITSAVRSQMISSTAAAPGKAGTSRGLNVLKRKVLPGQSALAAQVSVNEENAKNNKRKALEDVEEVEESQTKLDLPRKRRVVEKECKPGYCENCREKFEDFDEHIVSKIHRKFAHDTANFAELDQLLAILKRV